ncbi:MAG: hypothetical protein ACE5OR_11705 [bacterium]
MESNEGPKRGFSFRLSREKIEEFRKSTAEERLTWLEEVNEFVDAFLPREKRRLWERLRDIRR